MPARSSQHTVSTTAPVRESLARGAKWGGKSVSELVLAGFGRYLAGETLGPPPANLQGPRQVLALYVPDAIIGRVRKKGRRDRVALARLVASIAAEADPLAGPGKDAYILALARDAGVDVTDNPAAIFVLEVHLRAAASPRDLMRSVAAKLARGEGPLEGRLLLACALDFIERRQEPSGEPSTLAPLIPHLAPSRGNLVESAALTARTFARVAARRPPMTPEALYLLALGAHLRQLTTQNLAGHGDRSSIPGLAARDLTDPLYIALSVQYALDPARVDELGFVEQVRPWNLWAAGVLEAFCRLACEAGQRHIAGDGSRSPTD
jgi:hypothetical protein